MSAPEGMRLTVELLEALRDVVQGAYLMPPFGRYEMAAEILDGVRGKVGSAAKSTEWRAS